MIDSIELRRKIHAMNSFTEFLLFVDTYKENRKVYAFCHYAFLEKLIKSNKDTARLFVNERKDSVSPRLYSIMNNMVKGT